MQFRNFSRAAARVHVLSHDVATPPAASLVGAAPAPAPAPPTATDSWTSTTSNYWNTATDWTAGVPSASTDATIALAGNYIVGVADAEAAHSVTLSGQGVTLELGLSGTLTIGTTMTVAAGATVDIAGANGIAGSTSGAVVANAGLFEATTANLAYVDSAFTSTGTVLVSAGALYIYDNATISGDLAGAGTVAFGKNLAISAGTTLSVGTLVMTGGTLTPASGLSYAGALQLEDSFLALGGAGFTLTGNAGDQFQGGVITGGTLTTRGSISLNDLSIDGKATVANYGTATVTAAALSLGYAAAGTATLINASGATFNLAAGGNINAGDNNPGAIKNAGLFAQTGATSFSQINTSFTSTGTVTAAGTLYLDAAAKISGTLAGHGTIAFDAATSISTGTALSVADLSVDATTLTLGAGLSYAGALQLDAASLALGGNSFTLTGATADSFHAAIVTGGGTLATLGTSAVAGLTINGATTLANRGSASVTSGNLTLGGTAAGTATLLNVAGATFALTSGGDITKAGTSAAGITNAGLFEQTGSTGDSRVAPAFTNTGTVLSGGGTLAFLGAVTNSGTLDAATGLLSVATTISGTGTLDIGTTGTLSLLLGAASTQTADFLGGTGALDLTTPLDFAATIAGFGGSETITLAASTETTATYSGGTLTLDNGTTKIAALHFSGTYTQSDFAVTNSGNEVLIKFV